MGARFWISILGFCEPSSKRVPGAALENPTDLAVDGGFGSKLVGASTIGVLIGMFNGDGVFNGDGGSFGEAEGPALGIIGIPKVATGEG